MKNGTTKPLTLEERLELAGRSQAASPEAAARMVERLARMDTALVFTGQEDLHLMDRLIGGYMESLEDDLMHYAGFCRSFQLAIEDDGPCLPQGEPGFQPLLGARVNNAVVLLGLMLLDHARGKKSCKDVYHCIRMTLGQYLDALPPMCRPGNEAANRNYLTWRDLFLDNAAPSVPRGDALADILRRYMAGWRVLGRLDHTLRCMKRLNRCLEEEWKAEVNRALREAMRQGLADMGLENVEVVEGDEREHYADPRGHFLDLARSFSGDLPDPGAEDTAARAVRGQIFLSRWDYSPQVLEARAKEAPSPEFRALLEEQINPERIKKAMSVVNGAVSNLLMLLVSPYLPMEEERTRASAPPQ